MSVFRRKVDGFTAAERAEILQVLRELRQQRPSRPEKHILNVDAHPAYPLWRERQGCTVDWPLACPEHSIEAWHAAQAAP